uniref:ATP synthase complex subunit 8 n=1 Tax=Gekko hokouensis TaxID=146910 RepID=A0A342K7U7_9SAUR|nr:ATP synthase F0 subunit 8 [Gekko hokouensis]AMW90873.1 ATP synthase F0 subunit 8 [Gekko hokouensis]
MPQLNPAPWLLTFILVWVIILSLLKLMATLQNPMLPTKYTPHHQPTTWTWTWP